MRPKVAAPAPAPVPRSSLRAAHRDCVRFYACAMQSDSDGWPGFSCVACKACRATTLDDLIGLFDPPEYRHAQRPTLAVSLLNTIKRPTYSKR